MPNHIHLVLETPDPRAARWTLAIEMRAAGRKFFPGQRVWMPAAKPELISGKLHLQRMIRYVHLNPCRSALVADPIAWEWSTHRDVLGLAAEGWIDLNGIAQLFGNPRGDLSARFHSYVSSDPSVSVVGTPPLRPFRPTTVLAASPKLCIQAIAAVSRTELRAMSLRGPFRDAAIQLSANIARNPIHEIEKEFRVDERTIRRALRRPGDKMLEKSACMLLADPRCIQTQKG